MRLDYDWKYYPVEVNNEGIRRPVVRFNPTNLGYDDELPPQGATPRYAVFFIKRQNERIHIDYFLSIRYKEIFRKNTTKLSSNPQNLKTK